MTIVIIRSQ